MNKQNSTPADARHSADTAQASGKHEGLRHPIDENQREEQRLGEVGLDDRGDAAEDELRDRRSSGAGAQDQSANRHVPRH